MNMLVSRTASKTQTFFSVQYYIICCILLDSYILNAYLLSHVRIYLF